MKATLVLTALVVMFSGELAAQSSQATSRLNPARVADEVRQASAAAGVPVNQSGVAAFVSAAKMQGNLSADVYRIVPTDVRVSRLSGYLSAKAAASSAAAGIVTPEDLPDFHWAYIAMDVRYAPIKYQGVTPGSLISIESGNDRYVFPRDLRTQIKPGAAVLLPMSLKGSNQFTVTFGFDRGRGLWTGTAAHGVIRVAAARNTSGVEILVKSEPDEATVYFNGKQWREVTNFRQPVIQEPGIWEVLVRLAKHKDWRERRQLMPGDSWEVNATLQP